MIHPGCAAAFQDIQETLNIGADVAVGMADGVTHPRLRGQVRHAPGRNLPEQVFHLGRVRNIQFPETEVAEFLE